MIISDICIRRPVFATVLSLMLILLGAVSYNLLTVREYPKVDKPVVTVDTNYPGASAEIIETQVTKIIEDSLAGVEGIEVLSSISRSERSQISVRFDLERDPDNAASDVRDRVSRVRGKLPDEVDEPVISKAETDARPIIYLAFYSNKHTPMEITDYADRYVKDRIQNLSGVASVRIFGERRMSMRIWLQPERLAAYSITPKDVEDALRKQNVEIPAGRIESRQREFTVLSETDLRTPEQFNRIIIKNKGDDFIRLKDIGYATIAPEEERSVVRFNGQSAVALGIVKHSTANPLDVSKALRELLPQLTNDVPDGMKINIAYDSSVFIDRSIKEVYKALFIAIVLVILVIFIFLRNISSTIIPLLAIPISLITTFYAMLLLGFSINTLSLLALVLAIGMVVDDAIIMMENIYRHVENGMSPREAAFKGSKEISFAVIATTVTLVAVYTPVAFISGVTGKLFIEFAITLAAAVVISSFVALTLSPMMCSKLLKYEKKHGWLFNLTEKFFHGMNITYYNLLKLSMKAKSVVITIGIIIAGSSFLLLPMLKSELAPTEDRGTIVGIMISPEGSTIDYTSGWVEKLEPIYSSVSEVEKYFIVAGWPTVSQGISFVRLKDWELRNRTQQDIVSELQPKMFAGLPGIMAFPTNPPSLGGGARSSAVEFVIQTGKSYEELNSMVDKMLLAAAKYPGINNPDSDLRLNKPQISVTLERDKVAAVGASVDDIGRTLETMLGGRQVTRFKHEGEQYDVIVKIDDRERTNPEDVSNIYVRGNNDKMIKLSNLIHLEETVAPKELNHFNQLRAAKITANIQQGYTLGDALDFLDKTAKEVLPASTQIDYDGESREFRDSSGKLSFAFILSVCFVYLVLCAQFESFKNPFVIMLTVPLSIAGALFFLFITGGTINIYTQIAMLTLMGLITKHGILIVEFAEQIQRQGKSVLEATIEASTLRLRPILMTVGSTVLGAVPLAIASGAGAEARQQIGWVIVGGMIIGTIFTLFVIPVVYTIIAKEKNPPHTN